MRKLIMIALAVFILTTPAYAEEMSSDSTGDGIVNGMGQRIVRGAVNLVTGIVEVPAQIIKGFNNGCPHIENELGSKTVGTVVGIFRGVSHAGGRMSWGALELLGFWAASPASNIGVGIPLDAEHAWEEGTQYDLFDPSFGEAAVTPVSKKLVDGVVNGVFGVAEFPGQILLGADEGNALYGVVKGLWYWASREAYGITNIYSCLVPNPEDNLGAHLPDDRPWTELAAQLEA